MPGLLEHLVARIRRAGPLPFAAYMALALYDPRYGYYASGAVRTGRSGDFMTSPELDRAYGALWTRGFEQVWDACGRPERFELVEVGGAEATFAHAVLSSLGDEFRDALHLTLVERVPLVEARQRERLADYREHVGWAASLDEVPPAPAGCVFANEVLDNVPVHLVERHRGELTEIYVDEEEGRLVERHGPPSSLRLVEAVEHLGLDLDEGHRAEVSLAASAFVTSAGARIEQGAVIFVDYGITPAEAAERPRGTLVCYSAAGLDDDALARPGGKDITAHVNWGTVTAALEDAGLAPVGPRPQAAVLRNLGIADEDRSLRREHDDALAAGRGAVAVRALSRRHALAAMVDERGLGGLGVVAGAKGVRLPFMET